ncbi:MAG: hypothetical protein ACJATG_002022, partial [Dinoroseobacter sp.]
NAILAARIAACQSPFPPPTRSWRLGLKATPSDC